MSEFVEECRREWRRLGVPDPVANEMAADLTADLDEAEAEGGTPEDVLGNSAFDPRRFAGAWAVARGVTGPPVPAPTRRWRQPVAIGLAVVLGLLVAIVGLALLIGRRSQSVGIAVRRAAGVVPIRIPGQGYLTGPPGPPVMRTHWTQFGGIDGHPIALVLLVVGVISIMGLGLLAILWWSPWSGHHRNRRDGGPRTPSWS